MWEGPPTDKNERSGKVKDTAGSFLGEKKGLKGGKLENCRRMPVHPVSAMRGGEGDAVVHKLGRLRQQGLSDEERGLIQPILGGERVYR